MNVSQYLVKFLEEKNIDTVFGVVGGAALWICKALGESEMIKPIFTNHEQAATMAADGWARVSGKPGIVFTINGPGMTNTVTGIAQAWVDSSPVILITGNSNLKSVLHEREKGVRQYGTQDVRTDTLMSSITKKHFLLEKAEDVRACLEEAYFTAMEGRPGPVCIEIPINVQSAEVPDNLAVWKEEKNTEVKDIDEIIEKLAQAKRPLVLAGQGVRLAGAAAEFRKFVEKYQIPVVNSRMGIDTIASDSPYFVGRVGNHGSRASHFAVQKCDVLLVLGSRLAPNTTGYDVSKFSQNSYKILVELDELELDKYNMSIEQTVHADVKDFLMSALQISENKEIFINEDREKWITCCQSWKERYPIMQQEYYLNDKISTYRVVEEVSKFAGNDDLILSDTGSCCSIVAQEWFIKDKQRLFISGGLSAMGYWATTIGLAIANNGNGQVICFVGDGSLQMNIHELATIKQYGLPIKMFVISNNGYQFVKMSQSGYGITPPFGTDIEAGVPIPNIKKIVEAYGLSYAECSEPEKLAETVKAVLDSEGAVVCELFVDENQEVCPRLKSIALEDGTFVSPNYENLYPFLDEEVLKKEMTLE